MQRVEYGRVEYGRVAYGRTRRTLLVRAVLSLTRRTLTRRTLTRRTLSYSPYSYSPYSYSPYSDSPYSLLLAEGSQHTFQRLGSLLSEINLGSWISFQPAKPHISSDHVLQYCPKRKNTESGRRRLLLSTGPFCACYCAFASERDPIYSCLIYAISRACVDSGQLVETV